jgi:predicted ester cyclase
MFAGFPDLSWTLHDTPRRGRQGDRLLHLDRTHQGEFMGIPATGRTATIEAWTIDRY